jgi:hypothetical protein
MIKSEGDVRQWVREEFTDRALWVEAKSGGTFGFPDCLLAVDGRLWPLELKYGQMISGYWHGDLRLQQARVGKILWENGLELHILVGSKSENVLWFTSFTNYFPQFMRQERTKMVAITSGFELRNELAKVQFDKNDRSVTLRSRRKGRILTD